MTKKKKSIYPLWVLTPAILIYTLFSVVPIVISLVCSFTDWNMGRLYTDNHYPENRNRISACACYGKKIPGRGIMRTIYYAPCVISITVVGVLFKAILANKGLLNNVLQIIGLGGLAHDWLGSYGTAMGSVILVETWMWAGFNMFIFISGLQAIPEDYYESATLEGASAFEKLKNITLPLIVPSMTVVVTLSIAGGLKVFDIIYVITNGGPGFDTQVLATYTYQSFSLGFLGESSAGSIILAIIVVIISFTMNHYLTKREVEM